MKPRETIVLLVVLCIGVLLGRVSGSFGTSSRDTEDGAEGDSFRTRVSERDATAVSDTPFARLRKEIRTAPPDQCATLLRRGLETVDPFERRALFDELMTRMDASNFLEMSMAPARDSLETGRDNNAEWLLVHTRAGQVAGAKAMSHWAEQSALADPRAERTLWGWASQDPEAARKWLGEQADLPEGLRERLFLAIMKGAIVNDPQRAIALLESLPDEDRALMSEPFVSAFVEQLGKDRAIEWLRAVRTSEPESQYGQRLTLYVFDKTMWAGANQADARVMVADIERLASIMSINEAWIKRGMDQIHVRKTTGGIELIDQIVRSPTLSRIPLGESVLSNAVGYAKQRDRVAVAKWLSENKDSPIHSVVSSMAGEGN
jgi:hypothetical protein